MASKLGFFKTSFFKSKLRFRGKARYRVGKFIAFRPLNQSARRWLNIVAIGLQHATHGSMADGVPETVCG